MLNHLTTLGLRLRAARQCAHVPQARLAAVLAVSIETVRRWESDRSEPRAGQLAAIAGLCGTSVGWLVLPLTRAAGAVPDAISYDAIPVAPEKIPECV